jgi:tetratricopeptide (TPR) repeat protein
MLQAMLSKRAGLISRTALGAMLALGALGAVTATFPSAAHAKAPALKLSKGFQPLALEAQKAIEAAKTTKVYDDARAKVEAAFAAIANNDDRFMAGNFAVGLGGSMSDPALQRRGIAAMLESGKVAPGEQGKFNFYLGQLAYQARDYAAAIAALQTSINLGYRENDPEIMLAEAMIASGQVTPGLVMLKQGITARKAAGTLAPQNWYRRGLGAAYGGKMLDQATDFAMLLARDYPTKDNWAGAITVVREIGKFPAQETLDLMRLMDRTGSYAEERDYIEYIQAADARRLPGEVLKVISAGKAAGKLRAGDMFVNEALQIANERIAADRSSLVALERDARSPNASAATLMGAGDAFLSYDQLAKANEFYTIALAKPGADMPRMLTRLGIAQVGLGQYAEAAQTFARVEGPRKPIAQLWALFAAQKLAPPVVAPATSAPAAAAPKK